MNPNFLFIGPDKTGSSWIFEYLRRHDQCFIPDAKDIYFFDREYHRGWAWYAAHFASAPPAARAVGELSHDYILSDMAADRIKVDLPDVKLVAAIRNPVDRTYSHYLYLVRSGLTRANFRDALMEYPELIENSRYSKLLPRYLSRFPAGQLCLLFFDDLDSRTQVFADALCDFLGIHRQPATDIGVVRPATKARIQRLATAARMGANAARALGMPNLVGRIKHSAAAQALYVPLDKKQSPQLSSEDREMLLDTFAGDIASIANLTGRNLDGWRDKASKRSAVL